MFRLYAAIWRVSSGRQIILIVLAIMVAALAAAPLNFQKDIVNGLTDASVDHTQLYYLCAGMMGVILLSLTLKWILGYRASVLGEDVIRLIRMRVYEESVEMAEDDVLAQEQSIGTLTTIISAEAEELGKFTGNAFSEPVVQIGTLISVIGFILATQPGLGLIALCMILPQVIIVLITQRQVNKLVAERIRILRKSTDRLSEADFEAVDTAITGEFDRIYETRRKVFIWKLSTKFLLSSIMGAGTVAVLALGGALVLRGQTDVGTVVAATIGLGRLQGPTSFLIAFYRQVSATRVKYDLLLEAGRITQAGARSSPAVGSATQ